MVTKKNLFQLSVAIVENSMGGCAKNLQLATAKTSWRFDMMF